MTDILADHFYKMGPENAISAHRTGRITCNAAADTSIRNLLISRTACLT